MRVLGSKRIPVVTTRFAPHLEILEQKLLLDGSGGSGGPYYTDGPGSLSGMRVQGAGPIESTDTDGVTTYHAVPGMTISTVVYTNFPSSTFEMAAPNAKELGQTFAEDDLAKQKDLASRVTHTYTSGQQSDSFDFIVGTSGGLMSVNFHAHTIFGGVKTGTFKLDVEIPNGSITVTGNSGMRYGPFQNGAPSNDPNAGQIGWMFGGQAAGVPPVEITGMAINSTHVSGTAFFTQLINIEERIDRQSGDFLYLTTKGFVQDGGSMIYQGYTQDFAVSDQNNIPIAPNFGTPIHITDSPRFTPPVKAGDPFTRVAIKRTFQTMLMWAPYSTNGSTPIVLSTAQWSQIADSAPGAPEPIPAGPWVANGDGVVKFPEWVGRISDGLLGAYRGDWPLRKNPGVVGSIDNNDLTDGDIGFQTVSTPTFRSVSMNHTDATISSFLGEFPVFIIPPDLVSDMMSIKKDKKT